MTLFLVIKPVITTVELGGKSQSSEIHI